MNENIELSGNDFRSILPCFAPEAMKANQAPVDLLKQIGKAQEGGAGADRACLAVGAER